jgi:hypothetical protein
MDPRNLWKILLIVLLVLLFLLPVAVEGQTLTTGDIVGMGVAAR